MNKLILILAITLTTSVHAKDNCIVLSEISANIMSNRQHGTDITRLINLINKPRFATQKPYAQIKIIDAYNEPRYSTTEYQDQAIADFKNEAYLECFRIMNK